jgi:hypothetical protein
MNLTLTLDQTFHLWPPPFSPCHGVMSLTLSPPLCVNSLSPLFCRIHDIYKAVTRSMICNTPVLHNLCHIKSVVIIFYSKIK